MEESLIGWLRDVGDLSHEELVVRFDASAQAQLRRLIQTGLVGVRVPENISADDFANVVKQLRGSHREWNRALATALIKAEDACRQNDRGAAAKILNDFSNCCAWVSLKEIAKSEAERYQSGESPRVS